jgi:translation initiation factor 2B subunit (eIF-2B alpha/beta/delta family)
MFAIAIRPGVFSNSKKFFIPSKPLSIMKKRGKSSFTRILEDIKSVKIQGAENIARAGIKAYLLQPNKKSANEILATRPTEPLMQNALNILQKTDKPELIARKFISNLKKSHQIAAKKGASLIKRDMNVYTHCHSSSVIDLLKYAKKKQKKNFVVYTTEVEPLLQGRQTAKDLSKEGIKVIVFPDLAAEPAIKKCDLVLFGADAYTKRFVVNKIGTDTICKIAQDYGIPRYSCGVSMKFTKKVKIEKRKGSEVWDDRSKMIDIENPAFDKTRYKFVTGIISEFGILSPKQFVKKAKEKIKKF